mgnify:CR=1 FL=1|tara:strand:+ start:63 stop:452 length:390 start_codon:yes stop_codon:yes gene_type:complete
MSIGSDIHSALGWGMSDEEFMQILEAKFVDDQDTLNKIKGDKTLFNSLKSTEQSRGLAKRQKVFDIAAEGGAQDGGPAIGGGGTSGLSYVPQRDITKTFPGSLSEREEEERLALRAPGFATFGQPYSWT